MSIKIRNSIILIVTIISLLSMSNVQGFVPEDMQVKAYTFSSANAKSNLNVGELVNFTVVVKNLTNETITNVTIFQQYARSIVTNVSKMVNTPLGAFNGPMNYTSEFAPAPSPAPLDMINVLTGEKLEFNYFNITYNNFTLNLPSIDAGDSIGIGYTLNLTKTGTFSYDPTRVEYYDHWMDKNIATASSMPNILIAEPEENKIAPFFPEVEVDEEIDYYSILLPLLSIIMVAILSRIVYFKNPFNL